MSASFSVALPPSLQRRGEIVGAICGLATFPLVFNAGGCAASLPAGPAGVILPMVLGSALAGVIVCTVERSSGEGHAGFAPRVGIRGGTVAAVVGGAVTVFAATLHAFGIGHPAENGGWLTLFALVLPRSRPWQTFIIALLGLPPAIFFGMAGSFLTAMLRLPPVPGAGGANAARRSTVGSALFIVILTLSAIGYLSPFTIPLFPKPKPIVVAPVVPPVVEPPPAPPPPPKWAYHKPDGLDIAEAQNIDVGTRRTLGEIAAGMPVALSPDGRSFAYCVGRGDSVGVEIRDLETLDTAGRFAPGSEPTGFAWSPDSRRLLILTEQRGRHVAVFDPGENRLYPLPQPKGARLPDGLPFWWEAKEVLFTVEKKAVAMLNLDTLRARPVEESAKWKALTKEQQDEAQRRVSIHLGATPRWRMSWGGYVRDYDVPLKAQPWQMNEQLHFALFHPAKSYVRIFPNINAGPGDEFVAADDGSKIIQIRNQQAEVIYFELRMPPTLNFRVKTPAAPESALADALTKKTLCGLVCAPLINPLNGKTVGPDRSRVKALARIAQWTEREAEVWIEEEYFTVQLGDVLADLHTWEERRTKAAGEAGRGEWWTVIESPAATSGIPLRKDVTALDRGVNVAVTSPRGADRLESVDAPHPPRQAATSGAPAAPSLPQPARPLIPATNAEAQRLLSFIVTHHAKSSRNDVTGMLADYGERVDYLSHGIVDQNFIRKDETGYHAPGTRVLESVRSAPLIEEVAGGGYSANYTMAFEWHQANGRWSKGLADISLQIELTPDGPKITRQRAEVRERQQGP